MRIAPVVWGLVVVSACGGGTTLVTPHAADIIVADPIPEPLPQLRLPVTGGPFLDTPACEANFNHMLSSLASYEAAAVKTNAGLFARIEERRMCDAALATLQAGCKAGDPTTARAAITLNECVLLAGDDPLQGPAVVQVALGQGFIDHAKTSPTCGADVTTTAKTLRQLPVADRENMVLGLLGEDRRATCIKIAAAAAATVTKCDSWLAYALDTCLVEVGRLGPQSRRLVSAVAGQGVATREVVTSTGDVDGCPSVIAVLETPSASTEQLVPAVGVDGQADLSDGKALVAGVGLSARRTCKDLQEDLARTKCRTAQPADIRVVDVCTLAGALGFSKDPVKVATVNTYQTAVLGLDAEVQSTVFRHDVIPVSSPIATVPPVVTQGKLISGLADFLVTRAIAEVERTLAQDFVAKLCRVTWDGIAVSSYFGSTCKLLQGRFLSEAVSLRSFGSSVQRALENDLLGLLPAVLNAASSKLPRELAPLIAVVGELRADAFNVDAALALLEGAAPCTAVAEGSQPSSATDLGCALRLALRLYAKQPADVIIADAALTSWVSAHATLDVKALVIAVAAIPPSPEMSHALAGILGAILDVMEPGSAARALSALRTALTRYAPSFETVMRAMPKLLRAKPDLDAFFAMLATAPCRSTGARDTLADTELGCALRVTGLLWPQRGATNLAAAVKSVEADPSVSAWVAARATGRLEGLLRELAPLAAELDRLEALEVMDRVIAALHHNLNNTVVISAIEAKLGPVRERVSGLGRLAYVLYYAGRALLDGENPAHAIVTATQELECRPAPETRMTSEIPCALSLMGVTLGVFLETASQWNQAPLTGAALATYLRDVERRVGLVLRARSDKLSAWSSDRFGDIVTVSLTHNGRRSFRVFSVALFRAVTTFSTLLRTTEPELDGARRLEQLVTTGTVFFRAVIENVIEQREIRRRALRVLDHSNAIVFAIARRDLAAFATELYGLADDLGMPEPLPSSMREYLPLVTALAGAKTSDEVKAAFEKYAAEPGAFEKKTLPGRHFSLSGYVGVAAGAEGGFSDGPDTAGNAGLFVPVGIDVTWGGCRACGLFLNILDLGSVASLRLGDDVSATDDAKWSQVLAPGIGARVQLYGPLIAGVSATVAPGIRQDAAGDDETIWRALAFIAIDVTMFSF